MNRSDAHAESSAKPRVFSGIQPTGGIHLGNYLGAIRPWVAAQTDHDCIFCVVDLHAITVAQEPALLHGATRDLAALLLAAGIDPRRAALFVQSRIPAHAELAWILNCFIPMGTMERMTQFKEKAARREQVSVGLFDYPALMAADILLYETDIVPVGEDQRQHLELTRDVAQRFNARFGPLFKVPRPAVVPVGARIMALDDPRQKMSKSESRPGQALFLLDSPDEIGAKILRATTDSGREIRFDENRPGVNNLLVIYESLTGEPRARIEERFAGKGYADLKRDLAERVVETLRPIQERYRQWSGDPAGLERLLGEGAARVLPIAERTLARVKERLGLG
ncbi:MAG: tryptophan--tRNA ligase [Candidatus Eisenbacteria bacterium]